MADGGFDPCECIFSHEQAMQRLISLLRNTQSQCTDNECFNDGTGMPGASSSGGEHNFFMLMIGWLVIAITLYFLRPSRMRNRGDNKPSNNQGPSSPPPGSSLY